MSYTSISSITGSLGTTSLAQQLADQKNTTVSTLVSSLTSSGDSLTQTLCSFSADRCSISVTSAMLNSISRSASESGVSDEVIENVRLFAASLQTEGYGTTSILRYLTTVRNLAEDDPDKLTELFSNDADSTSGTSDTDDASSTTSDTDDTGTT